MTLFSSGDPRVAVVSEELWRSRFSADPGLVGRTITLDGVATTVIGIAPAGLHVPHGDNALSADLWVPMRFTAEELAHRGHNFLNVLGRLATGATVKSGNAELRSLFDAMIAIYPQLRGESARAVALQSDSVGAARTPLLLVFGAVCAVLVIAAANVGSLLLARGVHRRREMALRTALGASRWAVMRPVVAESVLLTAAGGALGIGLAWLAVQTIGRLAIERLPQLSGLAIEARIVVFALALSGIVALLCGALPAWHSATVDPQDALRGGRGGGATGAQHRALGGLVIAEVALSLMLLIVASLVLRGFAKLVTRDPGFDPRPMLTLQATISPSRYTDTAGITRFLRPALAAIEQIPGVQIAGAISDLPYKQWGSNSNIRYEGQPNIDPEHFPLADDRDASPGFFRAMGQRLLAGRLLRDDDDDRAGVPMVVVANEALVRRDFPHQDPVGKRFYVTDSTLATIVGVVSDIPNAGPIDPVVPEVYWSFAQGWARSNTAFNIIVRTTRGDPMALEKPVRAAIHTIDPTAAVSEMAAMTDVMAQSVGTPRFYLSLIATFALVAVLLAVAGLYGVMSYAVAQRTRELGIRTALGSSTALTLRMVTRQGMRLVGIGIIAGALGGVLATRLLASLLYGVSRADAPTWLLATTALAFAGLVASLLPAVRAARVDPIIAIRVE
jgi:putative ABC transport system permease protein